MVPPHLIEAAVARGERPESDDIRKDCPEDHPLRLLMEQCWQQERHDRPPIKQVREEAQKLLQQEIGGALADDLVCVGSVELVNALVSWRNRTSDHDHNSFTLT